MPKETGKIDPIGESLRIGFPESRSRPPKEANDNRPANDVQSVQARQREINRGISVMPWTVGFHRSDLGGRNFQLLVFHCASFGRVKVINLFEFGLQLFPLLASDLDFVAVDGDFTGLLIKIEVL